MKILASLYIIILVGSTAVFSQSADSTETDSLQIDTTELEARNDSVLTAQSEEVKIKVVSPWKNNIPAFSNTITNDSLLRWNIYPNWGDFYAYRNDAISYRQGTIGRVDAFNIRGFDQYQQNVWLDDILLNDPVTGLVNYNYVPHHKIGSVLETYNGVLNSYINIRDYYITEPISYLNFDEASNDYRNLEFFVAQNTAPGTNIELSYWDRRDGGFYPNNNAEGSQIVARVYHHLGEKYQIQGVLLRNDFNKEESGGYVADNPLAFPFGEFTAPPRSSVGDSEVLRTDIKAGIYQRADTNSTESAGLVFSRTKNDRVVRINADTLNWELISYEAKAFKRIESERFSITGEFRAGYLNKKSGITLGLDDWSTLNTKLSGEFKITEKFRLLAEGSVGSRNTDHSGSLFSAGLQIGDPKITNLKVVASQEDKMPTIQSLYWQSQSYTGNPDLENQRSKSFFGSVTIPLGSFWEIGAEGRVQFRKDPIFLNSDSTFSNANSQDLAFGSGYVSFENSKFEIKSSAAYEYTLAQDLAVNEQSINTRDTKLWLRNSLFYKTYAFNRATFLKMGVRTLLSPFNYQSQFYNTELSYWQANSLTSDQSQQAFIPAFFRLDAELSARVRAIMVVIRWENALDGLGQAGYFEASSFPMPPRRLIVGIRAQFRN